MNFIKQLKALGRYTTDLVFPIYCLICNQEGEYLCASCALKIEPLKIQYCISCHKPTPFGKTHPGCVTKNVLDGIVSALPYSNNDVSDLIKIFKYKFISSLGKNLSLQLIKTINEQGLNSYFEEFILVPVPLHHRRFSWRGFNQSYILAQNLAEELNLSLGDKIIKRQKHTKPQTTLKGEERKINIQNAFMITAPVMGKKILIVDDVVTTGSTLNEIAKLLKKGEACEVWAITLAKD